MPLSDRDIFKEIEHGGLSFDPMIELNQVSTSSIDLRLANVFTVPRPTRAGVSLTVDSSVVSPEELFNDYADEVIVKPGDNSNLSPAHSF